MDDDDEEEEVEEEVEIAFSDCPAAVQKTLTPGTNGAEIKAVDKQTTEDRTIYETDVMIDGNNYEIRVAEDGLLISQWLDDEADEEEEE